MNKKTILFSTIFACALSAQATTEYYVATNGNDSAAGTFEEPFLTLNKAVSVALTADDVVWVNEGVYKLTNTVDVSKKAIIVRAVNDDPSKTILDGQGEWRCVSLRTARLFAGITVTNGTGTGAGFYVWPNGIIPVVSNCVVTGCAAGSGGGIYLEAGGTIVNCKIVGNKASNNGGGVYMNGGTIANSLICGNSATNSSYTNGGGLYLKNRASMTCCLVEDNVLTGTGVKTQGGGAYFSGGSSISNCVIRNNTGKTGGALYISGSGILSGCLVEGNFSADTGAGLAGTYDYGATTALVENCVFRLNTSSGQGGALAPGGSVSVASDVRVRNCFFDRNTGKSIVYAWSSKAGSQTLIESCTFVGNTNTYGRTVSARDATSAAMMSLQNDLFYDNVATASIYMTTPDIFLGDSSANITYCFTPHGAGLDDDGTNLRSWADPRFRDYENGDYRLKGLSPCRNAGTPVTAGWMTTTKDLGTGTFEETAAGQGVSLLLPSARPRVLDGRIDLGCFEYRNDGTCISFF